MPRLSGWVGHTTPIIHKHIAKDLLPGIIGGYRLSEAIPGGDEGGELQLQVEFTAWLKHSRAGLSPGPTDGCTADNNAAGTAVITHGQLLVVLLQRVLGPAEETANVEGVHAASVEHISAGSRV